MTFLYQRVYLEWIFCFHWIIIVFQLGDNRVNGIIFKKRLWWFCFYLQRHTQLCSGIIHDCAMKGDHMWYWDLLHTGKHPRDWRGSTTDMAFTLMHLGLIPGTLYNALLIIECSECRVRSKLCILLGMALKQKQNASSLPASCPIFIAVSPVIYKCVYNRVSGTQCTNTNPTTHINFPQPKSPGPPHL